MPSYSDCQLLPYSPQQLFDVVADVARYPEFLPWCRAARVWDQDTHGFLAELLIEYKGLRESYVSRVTLQPAQRIDATMVKGPFKHLTNQWQFTPQDHGTQIDFTLDFCFRSKLLERMMGGIFTQAHEKMLVAFETRAAKLYSPLPDPLQT